MVELETVANGSCDAHIWYLKNPTAGTDNIVVSHGSTTAVNVSAVSMWNVDQSTSFGTDVEGTGTFGTAEPSLDVTTTYGDLVFDVVATEAGITSSAPGEGQTEIRDNVTGAHNVIVTSRKYAESTTTTMSHDLSGSGTPDWAHIAVGVKAAASGGAVNILLDMITHKDQLVALFAEGDSHYAVRTNKLNANTDDWSLTNRTAATAESHITTGLLTNVVTSGEDIDAGLLASIGGELVAAVWHESNGTITFFSSADSGAIWTDESASTNIDIGSGNGPQGLLVYPDIDGTDKLYLGTAEGIWMIDTSPSTWTF